MDAYFVYVTATDEGEAKTIAKTVVEERLAACANLLGKVQSFYWWEGKMCEGDETALVLKTSEARKSALIERIRQLHSYDVPCIVCLPVADGNPDFIEWIYSETAQRRDSL